MTYLTRVRIDKTLEETEANLLEKVKEAGNCSSPKKLMFVVFYRDPKAGVNNDLKRNYNQVKLLKDLDLEERILKTQRKTPIEKESN